MYTLSWFGERADFKLAFDYTHTAEAGGDSSSVEVEDLFLTIQDLGHADVVLVKFELENATPKTTIEKDYDLSDRTESPIILYKQD